MASDSRTAIVRPVFKVVVGGTDVTRRLESHLSSMTLVACREDHADQLELEFEDTAGRIAMPRKGVSIAVSLGFDTAGMCLQGSYVVDEVEHRGAPDTIAVRARSARVSGPLATRKERSWSDTTVGHIVSVIAGEHGLTPRVASTLASQPVAQLDQTESDMALLRRLGKHWDAVATVKNGCLVFAPIGHGKTAGGTDLPTLTLHRGSGDRHHFQEMDRSAYTGVRARWYDIHGARGHLALAGQNGHVKILRSDYPTEADAKRAAEAELARVKRGAATFRLDLAIGRPDIFPEMPVRLVGWPDAITAYEWIVSKATHKLDGQGGYVTSIELENKAAASDHAAVDDGDDSLNTLESSDEQQPVVVAQAA
jgi:phage protein D